MIYLDNAATTKIDTRILKSMRPYLKSQYGNPGGLYSLGAISRAAIRKARVQAANLIGANFDNIIFTSGGSEANALAICGLQNYLKSIHKTHILVSPTEHDSVLKATEYLSQCGFTVEKLKIPANATNIRSFVKQQVHSNTGLVIFMATNNETGISHYLEDMCRWCNQKGILTHVDAVQFVGWNKVDVESLGCSSMSWSSHKIHGPKGVGALYAREPKTLQPLIFGGAKQEFGLRGGTENVAGIVGFGEACEILKANVHQYRKQISRVKKEFLDMFESVCPEVNYYFNDVYAPTYHLASPILSVRFDGIDAETLVLDLANKGVCVSAGSACRSYNAEPSHVLTAMGLSEQEARSTIRVSFSHLNTVREARKAAQIIAACASELLHRNQVSE